MNKLSWRSLRVDDAKSLISLLESYNPTGRTSDRPEPSEMLNNAEGGTLGVDCTTAGWLNDELVACAVLHTRDATEETRELSLEVIVHPERRLDEVELHVARWISETGVRLQGRLGEGTELKVFASVDEQDRWLTRVLGRAGFSAERTFADMRLTLDGYKPVQLPRWSYRLTPYAPDLDDEVRIACNEAFRDHWGTTPWSADSWRTDVTQASDFLPDLSFLLIEPTTRDVVAFVLCSNPTAEASAVSAKELSIDFVGTRTAARGQRLASGLLEHTLTRAAASEFREAALVVDFDGRYGALGLYERQGFRVTRRSTSFVLALSPRPRSRRGTPAGTP